MRSKILGMVTIPFLIFWLTISISTAAPSVSTKVNQGENISISINVNPDNNLIKGTDIIMKFDNDIIQFDKFIIGDFLGNDPMRIINNTNNTNGILEIGYTVNPRNPAVTSSGTFATLYFAINDNTTNVEPNISIDRVVLSDPNGTTLSAIINGENVTTNFSESEKDMKWKFISVPYQLNNSNVGYVLQDINYTELYAWDSVEKKWTSPVTNFLPLNGYLIKMNISQNITNFEHATGAYIPPFINLRKGYNLIGTSGNNSINASMMLKSIEDDYFSIVNWNVENQTYDIVGINTKSIPENVIGTDTFIMRPGISYWIWTTKDASLPALVP